MLIKPYVGIGDLMFSNTRDQIRQMLNHDFEEGIKEFEGIKDYYDYYPSLELFIYYNAAAYVSAFEVYGSELIYQNRSLLPMTFAGLVEFFKSIDEDLAVDYNEFTSYKHGIGGNTNDNPDDPAARPEAIIVFCKEYYKDR